MELPRGNSPPPELPYAFGLDPENLASRDHRRYTAESYFYERQNRLAILGPGNTGVVESYLFDGIDHPLRITRGSTTSYYELDLAGNVRGLRLSGGSDLGEYRYTAFGKTVSDTTSFMQN